DLSDAVKTAFALYLGGSPISCLDAADSNDSGAIDLSDVVYTLRFLLLAGNPPSAPGPFDCGTDPTDSTLGCVSYPADCPPPPDPRETFRFEDGFENADSLPDLIDLNRWHNVQIEPSTNRVQVTSEVVHSGTRALKLVAASASGGTTKAD